MADSLRRSVFLPGVPHRNPIPNASLVRGVLMSSVINGVDDSSGIVPETLEEQCELMFTNARRIVEAVGGNVQDIVKMNVWLKDLEDRKALNVQWEKMFPDPANRPARHAHQGHMRAELLIQCDIVAVLPTT